MKCLYILTLVLLVHNMYPQSYKYIKKLDTIYIPFKEGEFNIKIDYPEEINGFKNRSYIFNYKKKNDNSFYFEFDRNRISENKIIKKSFLKKNKEKIIKIDSLKKFDYQDIACDIFNRLKIIYIIDFSEKKGRSIKMYRVVSMNLCYAIE
ncbi:hypothetical protein [Flavobacterium phragmitis]|uniref:Uncharacterized protein n=1 Tax=Flavobacterium phragmitis TaxID=739143 RepID=A0A1I1K945_9FLAO|nr:hypothetical protein [Flavobacterium phragmitis]SFC55208.1 hypothetical protein SAMN05216297_101229 [Flavobacterium phragmitis]